MQHEAKQANIDWVKIEDSVGDLCHNIFKAAQDLIKEVSVKGFELLTPPNPSAEDRLLEAKLIDSIFVVLTNEMQSRGKPELAMKLINAREQILRMIRLIYCLEKQDEEGCEDLIKLLGQQAQIL